MTDWLLNWFPIFFALFVFALLGGFLAYRTVHFIRERRVQKARDSRPPCQFVFAKIMDSVLPMQRGSKYEKPLDEALHSHGLGLVTGGGTQMAGDGSVAWVGLDLDLLDLGEALEFTRQKLRELGAPPGSLLEYRDGEEKKTMPIA